MRTSLLSFVTALLTGPLAMGQNMTLSSGAMTIGEGTTLRLQGPIQWTLAPGTEVTNEGIIDLGTDATLFEPPGGPVQGGGMELARTNGPGPFTSLDPGGLGLSITTSDAVDTVSLERHHTSLLLPEGDVSIARWFRIRSSTSEAAALELDLRYDPTELNGLDPGVLALFEAGDALGPWTALASVADAGLSLVSAVDQAPWALITAFDRNASTNSSSLVAVNGFHAWPTLVDDVLHVQATTGDAIMTVEVFDGLGRTLPLTTPARGTERLSLDLVRFVPGAYYLRINGVHVIKFRKA